MKNEEKYPSGEYKEVSGEELHVLTTQGWRIISVNSADRVEVASRQVAHPNAGYTQNGFNTEHIFEQENLVVKAPRYLVWRDEASALGRLNEAFQKSQEAAKDQAHTLAKLESVIRGLRVSNEDLKKSYKSQVELMRKMEDDLGKVREVIGTKAFNEIVKEET